MKIDHQKPSRSQRTIAGPVASNMGSLGQKGLSPPLDETCLAGDLSIDLLGTTTMRSNIFPRRNKRGDLRLGSIKPHAMLAQDFGHIVRIGVVTLLRQVVLVLGRTGIPIA